MRYALVQRGMSTWQPVVTSVAIEGRTLAELAAVAEVGMADYAAQYAEQCAEQGDVVSAYEVAYIDAMCIGVGLAIDAYAVAAAAAGLFRFTGPDGTEFVFGIAVDGLAPA